MARAKLRDGRETWEVGQAIVAAWFKVLRHDGGKLQYDDQLELKRVFEEIFATPINKVELDPINPDDGIIILVPQPPVDTQQKLVDYLTAFHQKNENRHFHEELGNATIFGCGK